MKGIFLADTGQDGIGSLEQALQLALEARMDPQASDAYVSLQDNCINAQKLDEAQRYYGAGLAFC